jgi:hypothetical protein
MARCDDPLAIGERIPLRQSGPLNLADLEAEYAASPPDTDESAFLLLKRLSREARGHLFTFSLVNRHALIDGACVHFGRAPDGEPTPRLIDDETEINPVS